MYVCKHCHAVYDTIRTRCDRCKTWSSIEDGLDAADPIEDDEFADESEDEDEDEDDDDDDDDDDESTNDDPGGPVPLSSVRYRNEPRFLFNVPWFDDYIGDPDRKMPGVLRGSTHFFYGGFGFGKTTLFLELLRRCRRRAVFCTYEQLLIELQDLASRLEFTDEDSNRVLVYRADTIEQLVDRTDEYEVVVLDSLHAARSEEATGDPGSNSQNAAVLHRFVAYCQRTGAVGIVTGQINKEGEAKGANEVPHAVTSVHELRLDEGDIRVIEAQKNRQGPTMGKNGQRKQLRLRMESNGLMLISATAEGENPNGHKEEAPCLKRHEQVPRTRTRAAVRHQANTPQEEVHAQGAVAQDAPRSRAGTSQGRPVQEKALISTTHG